MPGRSLLPAVSVSRDPANPIEVPGDAAKDAWLVEVGATGAAADRAQDEGANGAPADAIPTIQGPTAVACKRRDMA